MLDAEANQLLARADQLAQEGRGEDAAGAFESAADRLLAQGNALGAAVAYQRALHQLANESLPRAQKLRISERLANTLVELGMASGLSRERRVDCLFRAAGRYWSSADYVARGHRAVCFACGEIKAASWMRCSACRKVPHFSEQVGLSLLVSERACPIERLQEVARRIRTGEEPVAHDVQRLFATALYQSAVESEESSGRLLPGTVTCAEHPNQRAAVLLEVSTSADFVSEKSAFTEFVQTVCVRLLDAPEHSVVDELSLHEGRSVHELKGELGRRLGSKLQFERWQRVQVERGAVASAVVGAGVSEAGERRPHHVRLCGNLAAAVVALATPELEVTHPAVRDLASQLASQLVRPHVGDAESQDWIDSQRDTRLDFAAERFACDPSLSVAEALSVLSTALSSEVRLESVVCYLRRRVSDEDPSTFPGEAAMHG